LNGPAGTLPPRNEPSPQNSGRKLTRITIIHTNDIHGRFEKLDELGSTIAALRAANPGAVLVDTGDIAYNPPYSDSHHYEPMPEYFNRNKYDIMVPGNHEFQWGNKVAENELFSKLQSEILCANVLDKATGKPFPWMKPYIMTEIQGVKVAFIGLTTRKMATDAHPNVGKDLIVLNEKETLAKYAAEVREKGAQVTIVLTHQGLGKSKEAANVDTDVDLIIGGHDHELTRYPILVENYPNKTWVVEAGHRGEHVGETTIFVDSDTKKVLEVQAKPIPSRTYRIRNKPAADEGAQDSSTRYGDEGSDEFRIADYPRNRNRR
jgi:2',3'-cyclic-nucleotide 2'-phosphodiesterase (5'-nucleotidase family)